MKETLKPTLWRTARALANADRLRLFREVYKSQGAADVTELAEAVELPIPIASTYLRALNARGLVSVVRTGSYVLYPKFGS